MTNIKNIISKHQNVVANFDFPEKDRGFKKLTELELNKKYTILALFINTKGKLGDQGILITDDHQVNMPLHLTDLAKELRQDVEVIEAINNRELAFEIYEYTNDFGKARSLNLVPSEQPQQDDSKGRAFDTSEEAF
ncbi:MAG: hypothetical protein ACTJH3_11535 [Staphylococcus equorum]